MNMQRDNFHIGPLDESNLSLCITDDIKTDNNGGLMMGFADICLYYVFNIILSHFLKFSLIFIHMQIRRLTYLTTRRKACV